MGFCNRRAIVEQGRPRSTTKDDGSLGMLCDAQGNESSGPFIHHHTGTKVGMPRKANAQRSIARSWRKYRISNA